MAPLVGDYCSMTLGVLKCVPSPPDTSHATLCVADQGFQTLLVDYAKLSNDFLKRYQELKPLKVSYDDLKK